MRRTLNTLVKFIIIALCFLPATCLADISLDYSYSQDYYQGESINGQSVKLNLYGKKSQFDYRLYRVYGKSGDIKTKDNGGVGLGYDPVINKTWRGWGDVECGFNRALNIDREIFLAAGLKYVFYENEGREASLSFGGLYQSRQPGDYLDKRLSLRPQAKWGEWKGMAFYQPKIGGSADYILKGDIEGRISESTAFFTNYEKRSIDNSKVIMTGLRFKIK